MAVGGRAPRIWIDVEAQATFGSAAASIEMFSGYRDALGPLTQAWLFHTPSAPLLRGFYYPLSVHDRFGVPKGRGPQMVLIDHAGDQLWLSGAGCGPGELASAALSVLGSLDVALASPSVTPAVDERRPGLANCDEMHYVDGQLVGYRPLGTPVPAAPPGRTFVRGGRLVNRMEFDKGGVSAADLRRLWTMATEPAAWLERPVSLILYGSRRRSEEAGHDGCRLIARGQSGRELWLQLPEPDEFDRLTPGRQRSHFEGSVTEFDAVTRSIFHTVGVDIDPPDDRPLRHILIGRHRVPPDVIRWP